MTASYEGDENSGDKFQCCDDYCVVVWKINRVHPRTDDAAGTDATQDAPTVKQA